MGQPAVIVQYVQMPSFGVQPVTLTCPHCQAHVRTRTESEPGPLAWILGGILCVVGLPFCACIPCCIDSFNSYPQVSSMQGVPREVQGRHVGLCEHEEVQVEGSKVDERQI